MPSRILLLCSACDLFGGTIVVTNSHRIIHNWDAQLLQLSFRNDNVPSPSGICNLFHYLEPHVTQSAKIKFANVLLNPAISGSYSACEGNVSRGLKIWERITILMRLTCPPRDNRRFSGSVNPL